VLAHRGYHLGRPAYVSDPLQATIKLAFNGDIWVLASFAEHPNRSGIAAGPAEMCPESVALGDWECRHPHCDVSVKASPARDVQLILEVNTTSIGGWLRTV